MKRKYIVHVQMSIVIISIVALSSIVWAQPGESEYGFEGQEPQLTDSSDQSFDKQRFRQKKPGSKRPDKNDAMSGIRINWRALKLTEEQKEQIKQHRRNFQINTAAIREELKYVQQDLGQEMQKDTVDRTKIDRLVTDLSNLKRRLNEAAIQNILAIKSVLTQEQLNMLANQQVRLPKELQRIQLTSEQRMQVRQIMKDSMQTTRGIQMELQDFKLELREMLLSSDEVNSAQLEQLQASIAEKELALEKTRIDGLLQMREVLTPEQLKSYKRFRGKKQKTTSDKGN